MLSCVAMLGRGLPDPRLGQAAAKEEARHVCPCVGGNELLSSLWHLSDASARMLHPQLWPQLLATSPSKEAAQSPSNPP